LLRAWFLGAVDFYDIGANSDDVFRVEDRSEPTFVYNGHGG
jgi:hypothetical protein